MLWKISPSGIKLIHFHYDSYYLDCIAKVKTDFQTDLAVFWREDATLPNRKRGLRSGGKGRNKSCQSELMQKWSQHAQRCRLNVPNVFKQAAQKRLCTESSDLCWKHQEVHREKD